MLALAISAEEAAKFAYLREKRERKGPNWCLEKGFGKERRRYGYENVLPFKKVEAAERAANAARDHAAAVLGAECRNCKLTCVLARR